MASGDGTGRGEVDAGYWILDAGCWILDAGYWILDAGYWMMDTGCWFTFPRLSEGEMQDHSNTNFI